jgi:small subunit ribosomal protein S20
MRTCPNAPECPKLAVDKRPHFDTVCGSDMPNTKSAERRMRSSERKRLHNRKIKSSLKTLERAYAAASKAGDKQRANEAYRNLCSAFDKAAKSGVIHKAKADRKKSRLAAHLAPAK